MAITYISRTIYTWMLPRVTLEYSLPRTFVRSYEMLGTVVLSDEHQGYGAVSKFLMPAEELPPAQRAYAFIGDALRLYVKPVMYAIFDGTVLSMQIAEEGVWLTVGYNITPVAAAPEGTVLDISGGEEILAIYERVSYPYEAVVPSSAVHREGADYYMLTVREETGAMGREFIAERMKVYSILDELDGMIAISLEPVEELIITDSDRPVRDGDRVRFYP